MNMETSCTTQANPFPHCVLQTVQQRGAAVIKARKLSSAMSAAKAICDHMRDIWSGTPQVNAMFIYILCVTRESAVCFLDDVCTSHVDQAFVSDR